MRIEGTPLAYLGGGRVVAPAGNKAQLFTSIAHTGERVFQIATQMRDELDHDALIEGQALYVQGMTAWTTEMQQTRQGGGAKGYTKDFTQQHMAMMEHVTQQMNSNGFSARGMNSFNTWGKGRETVGLENAAGYEHQQMKLHAQDMHTLRVQSIFDSLGNNPMQYQDAYTQLEESYALAVGQGLYRPEEAKARFHEMQDTMRGEAFENLYAANRSLAMKQMDALGLNMAEKAKVQKRYQADVRHDAALANAAKTDRVRALNGTVEDVDYVAAQTGNVKDLRALSQQFAALGEASTAEKLTRRASMYEENYAVIKESQALPVPELAAKVAATQQELLAVPGRGLDEDASQQAKNLQSANNKHKIQADILQARVKHLEADPVGAVAPMVLVTESDTPEMVAGMRMAAQENNGVPLNGRRVLSVQEAAGLKAMWSDGDLEGRLAVAGTLQAYGAYAGKAAAEIGISPAEQLALLQVKASPHNAANLQTIITASVMKTSELPALEDAGNLRREASDASYVLSGYRAAARAMPNNQALQVNVRNLDDTLTKLLHMNGGDVEAAVKVLDGTFGSLSDGQMALVYNPAEVDGGKLEDRLQAALRSQLETFAKGRTWSDDSERKHWLAHMRRAGVWVNAPDGDGFVLIDPVAQAPATDDNGSILRVRAKDLRGGTQ